MSLFPLLTAPDLETGTGGLPLCREVAWDFTANQPIWRGGEPVYVTGASAVLVWAWNALHTTKGLHDVFTRDYGLGIEELEGMAYTDAVRQSEAVRYVQECLCTSPYIQSVEKVSIGLEGSTLRLTCQINTIYGEVNLDGCKL
jgi:hypothetical protein